MWNWIARRVAKAQVKANLKAASEGEKHVMENFVFHMGVNENSPRAVMSALKHDCAARYLPNDYEPGSEESRAFIKAANSRASLILDFVESVKEVV